ncbi:GMC family oxidoreductase [Actinoplanes sp. L3-i22]|uniref:GMC family oxidoreductase n=1 Tax=Actinoplanes sp. L3-i22 TaxID=2836373 RepID=UPI001C78E000|nr:FAD-dependent oxidoreductase [Actinoplanes sp. L3-i22]BCY10739.1 oxidoreductase [Actinoplanes sp. L3-i22]
MSDYLIVGGGTAGCLLAARLSENPDVTVELLEWGPSDVGEPRARALRRWAEMIEGEYDLDYRSVPQERGNSAIRQARLRILGGCSTANTMIAWRPLAADLRDWGVEGWGPDEVLPYFDRLRVPIQPVAPEDRNPFVADVVEAASTALGVPVQERWNDGRLDERAEGTGFFEVGYEPATNIRGSTSIHYLHDVLDRPNLTVRTGVRATRILIEGGRAVAVVTDSGTFRAAREIILCGGAIDSPRLLQLSGIGPRAVLAAAGVPLEIDLPGVGENLMDHAEGLILWEAAKPPPTACASGWDAGAMLSVDGDPARPDVLMHFPVEPWAVHAANYGVELPEHLVQIAPNVARPRSRGRVWITSADPDVPPSIDYRYFTDPDGHDERILIEGIRAARRIAEQEPFKSWLVREVFPGDRDLAAALRATHQTVYHVSGTCALGDVLDPELRVRGVAGLRVVDASVLPVIPSVNPVVTVMVVAERAADLIASAGQM